MIMSDPQNRTTANPTAGQQQAGPTGRLEQTATTTAERPLDDTAPGAQAGAPAAGVEAPAPMTVTEETATAEQAIADMRDRWQRAQAEVENTRKRYERQRAEDWRAERARVVAGWLPVLDNLDRALGHAGADPEAIVQGVRAVRDQAMEVLRQLGFSRLDDIGIRFDPARHEAATVVDDPGAAPGTVVEVLRPGYASPEVLLRPAVVAVAGKQE
jgi:molecular chaperone GrpE